MNASREELELTQFSAWYPHFKHLSIKSLVLYPPPDFSDFLKSDGLLLPSSVETDAQDNLSEDSDLKEVIEDEDSERPAGFPDLEAEISSAIQSLDGFVFVKSNWSAPIDASWMKAGNVRCRTVRDVYLLFKSSDRVIFDLEQCFEKCEVTTPVPLQIVVRKWANLNPSMEFRMFVYDGSLRAICQRDCCTVYLFLSKQKQHFFEILQDFFECSIRPITFISSYCVDVYVDKNKRIWIIDINAFGYPSSALLFEWEEIVTISPEKVQFRLVENEEQKLASTLASKRGPADVHLAQDFKDFMNICKQQNQEPNDSDQDE